MGRKGAWSGREPGADGGLEAARGARDGSTGRKGAWGGREYGAEGPGAWGGRAREPGAEGWCVLLTYFRGLLGYVSSAPLGTSASLIPSHGLASLFRI